MSCSIHDSVARAYTDAVAGRGGCCATGESKGVPSFGCGDPLALADVRPGQTVLDLGSGAGHDLLLAADAVGPTGRVIGVDMTDAMLEAARRHCAGRPNIELRKGFIESLPVDDASVDWVISNCVINLSPGKERVYREIRRVLKPDGRFSISDIVGRNLPASLKADQAAWNACVAGAIPEEEYVAGLRSAGLIDVEVADRRPYECGPKAPGMEVASARITGRRP